MLALLVAVLILPRIRRKRRAGRKRLWARQWILRSHQQGAYPSLVPKLNAEDPEAFRQFNRLDNESFQRVLAMVAPSITKQ